MERKPPERRRRGLRIELGLKGLIPVKNQKAPLLARAREMGHPRFVIAKILRLLDRAADLREDVAGIRADQADGSYDDDEDHRQHH